MKSTIIAEKNMYAVSVDGDEIKIDVKIYSPYKTKHDDWACQVNLQGLKEKPIVVFGFDSWQALILALGWVHKNLLLFISNGGNLFWEEKGKPIDMRDLFSSGLLSGD